MSDEITAERMRDLASMHTTRKWEQPTELSRALEAGAVALERCAELLDCIDKLQDRAFKAEERCAELERLLDRIADLEEREGLTDYEFAKLTLALVNASRQQPGDAGKEK